MVSVKQLELIKVVDRIRYRK